MFVVVQDVVLSPGQKIRSLPFDLVFNNNIALSHFIGIYLIACIFSSISLFRNIFKVVPCSKILANMRS